MAPLFFVKNVIKVEIFMQKIDNSATATNRIKTKHFETSYIEKNRENEHPGVTVSAYSLPSICLYDLRVELCFGLGCIHLSCCYLAQGSSIELSFRRFSLCREDYLRRLVAIWKRSRCVLLRVPSLTVRGRLQETGGCPGKV